MKKNKYLPVFEKMTFTEKNRSSEWWGKWIYCPTHPINLKDWNNKTWLAIKNQDDDFNLANLIWSEVDELWKKFKVQLPK